MQDATFSLATDNEDLAQGLQASQAGDSLAAIALFTKAALTSSTPGIASFLLGAEWAAIGDMKKAEAALADAVIQAPHLPIARYQLGLLQLSSGKCSQALLTWEPLLSLPAENPLHWFVQGQVALAQNHFEDAIAHFEAGIALNSSNEPLNGDIRKIVQRIHELNSAEESQLTSMGETDNQETPTHMFLSSYQRQAKLH